MTIGPNDMTELKRFATNSSDIVRACINRIIRGIAENERNIQSLKHENEELKKKLALKTKSGAQ